MLPAGTCVRVVLGIGKADRAIHGDIHCHHGYGRCRFVVGLEVRPPRLPASSGRAIDSPLAGKIAAVLQQGFEGQTGGCPHLGQETACRHRRADWSWRCPGGGGRH